MIRIGFAEDELLWQRTIQEYCRRFSEEKGEELRLQTFSDGELLLEKYTGSFDVLLLDIQMRFMDGLRAAQLIRERDEELPILFITSLPQYALQGYQVHARGFLIKPVAYDTFAAKLEETLAYLRRRKTRYYTAFTTDKSFVRVPYSEILFFEIEDRRVKLHTESGVLCLNKTLREVEEELADERFFRCHEGYLVNIARVGRVERFRAFVKGAEIAVSKHRKKHFMEALTRYLGEEC